MERGKEGKREGTRAKPGNQLVYYICIHLLDPHWNNMGNIMGNYLGSLRPLHNNTNGLIMY